MSMSTRKGDFVELGTLVSEIGIDAINYFYLMKGKDQHLDFDLEVAVSSTVEIRSIVLTLSPPPKVHRRQGIEEKAVKVIRRPCNCRERITKLGLDLLVASIQGIFGNEVVEGGIEEL